MPKVRPQPDYGLMSEAMTLARTGRYRSLKEVEKELSVTLPTLSKRDRAIFDGLCETARKEHLRNG
jgi:hypothetical protein